MATATLDENDLLNERFKIDAKLAEIESRKVFEHRRSLGAELQTCTVPKAMADETERLRLAADKAKKAAETATLAYQQAKSAQDYKAHEIVERRKVLTTELVETADPAIDAAAESLLKLAKESGVKDGVPKVQPIVNELGPLKLLALPTEQLHREIANVAQKCRAAIQLP